MTGSWQLMTLKEMVSPQGRLPRTRYLLHVAIYGAVLAALTAWLVVHYVKHVSLDMDYTRLRAGGFLMLAGLPTLLLLYAAIKRAHDLGMPAIVVTPMFLYYPCSFAAILFGNDVMVMGAITSVGGEISKTAVIGMGFYFLLAPGEKGPNRYGPDPLA